MVYGWYRLWVASNYVAYPFSGAMMDQPEWVVADFNTFGALEAWIDLDARTRAESETLHPTVQDA